MSATLRIPPQRRTPYWANRSQSLVCGYPVPASHHCTYRSELKHYDSIAAVMATYEVPGGPTFRRAYEVELKGLMRAEENRLHFDMVRKVFLAVCEEVRQHNAAVEPIDNGPEDRVAASEALARVVLANRTAFRDRREGFVLDDMEAANQRLCRLPYVGI